MRRCLTTCLLACAFVSAANAADVPAQWRRDFAEPIAWQRVTALGDLLVGTTGALYAVDPATGEIRWSHRELANMPGAGIVELAGSSLVLVTGAGQDPRTAVVNMRTGALVFDSRKEAITRISATHVLARSGGLLIAGFQADKLQPTLFLYNIDNGQRLWTSDALNEGMSPLMKLVVSAALQVAAVSPVQSAPFELGDGTFVLGAMGNLYRFERDTGKVVWKAAYSGGRFEFVQSAQRPDVLYVGAEEVQRTIGGTGQTATESTTTGYQAFQLSDGKPLWKRPMQFRNPMNREIVALEGGLLVNDGNGSKGRLYLLDYGTGQSLWGNKGRGIEINGLVLEHAATDAGLLLTTGYDSIWTNKDTEYLVYVLDTKTGAFRFPEPLKVKGRLLTTELTAKGLLYVTTHELNVFDPMTGKLLSAPLLRGKQPIVTTSDERSVFAYSSDDGLLYRFDRESAEIVKLSQTPFTFDENDQPRSLDAFDGRLVLIGQQSVAGFTRAGALQFNSHYKAPRDPAWLRGLAWAEGIRAGMASAYAGAYSAAFANAAANSEQGSLNQEVAHGLEKGFSDLQQGYQGLATDYVSFARKRYQASAEARDFVFMMVQGNGKDVSLAQVSKIDGKIIGQIPMHDDKEPSYEVDDVGSLLFYHPAPTTVTAYKFSPQRVQVAEAPRR